MTNPVKWRGKVYPSQRAAAKDAGVSDASISLHLERNGSLDRLGEGSICPPKPTEWNGVVYPSIKDAAKAAGVSPGTIHYHMKKYGNLDRMGVGS